MIRIVFPYILFVSLVSLAAACSTSTGSSRSCVHAGALNVSSSPALFLAPYCDPPIKALAWGVFIARGATRPAAAPLAKIGMLVLPRFDWRDAGFARARCDGPRCWAYRRADLVAHQHAARGALATDDIVDHLCDRLMEFPTASWVSPWGPCCCRRSRNPMPTRTRAVHVAGSTGDCAPFMLALRRRSRSGARDPLISTLYKYGRSRSRRLQTRALLATAGLLGLILVKSSPGFYARQIMATPVKVAFATVVVSQTLAVILMFPLDMPA